MHKKIIPIIVIVAAIILVGVIGIINKDKKNKADKDSSADSIVFEDEDSSVPEVTMPPATTTTPPVTTTTPPQTTQKPDATSQTGNDEQARQVASELSSYVTLSYYKPENKQAYINYKVANKTLSYEKVITYVNIGLDRPFYTGITQTKDYSSLTALVNKYYALPSGYAPSVVNIPAEFDYAGGKNTLRQEACDAFVRLCSDAKAQGYTIRAKSTYRSFNYQNSLYNNYVKQDGKKEADTYSARPGHSEHQTGLAIDVIGSKYTSITSFDKEKEYPFVKENAHQYGFIIRYPENSTHITGYQEEPWHLRFVGVELATKLYNEKLTLDEYYAIYR